jgi:uncharacterized protein (TIGR03503 family)
MTLSRNTLIPLVLCFLPWSAVAQQEPQHVELAPDVRVIVDISGSMKQNDPNNLRRPAVELLLQLFPDQSKAGVWTFGQWVNMLIKHQAVDDNWRKMSLPLVDKINSVALHTNIPEALEKATHDLDKLDRNFKTHLILLTDGMVDVSKDPAENNAARKQVLSEILPRLKEAGVTIHAVALSKNADSDLMDRLAIETGGLSAVAETADDLTRIFLQAFDAAAPAEELPIENNSFLVDSSVEEFTALVFRIPNSSEVTLISPDNKSYNHDTKADDVKWFSKQNYDLITIKRPYEGEWKIAADLEPNSRVTVVSDLSLAVNRLAINQYVSQQPMLTAVLQERGQNVSRNELLSLLEVTLTVTRQSDKKRWTESLTENTPTPEDGLYSTRLTMLDEPGIYAVQVDVDGKTFQRQQSQRIKVHPAFSTDLISKDSFETSEYIISLTPHDRQIDLLSTTVIAQITSPDGNTTSKAAVLDSSSSWKILLNGGNYSGNYSVVFDVAGKYKNGRSFKYRSKAVNFSHTALNPQPLPKPQPAPQSVPEPAPEPEPEPEPVVEEPMLEESVLAEQPVEDALPVWVWAAIIGGNLLIIGLGFVAYRMIKGDKNSNILDGEDFIEPDEGVATEVAAVPPAVDEGPAIEEETPITAADEAVELAAPGLEDDDLGLPDDAIDIDPGSDK